MTLQNSSLQEAFTSGKNVIITGAYGSGKYDITQSYVSENGFVVHNIMADYLRFDELAGCPFVDENSPTGISFAKPKWIKNINDLGEAGQKSVIFIDNINRVGGELLTKLSELICKKEVFQFPESVTFVLLAISLESLTEEIKEALNDDFMIVSI